MDVRQIEFFLAVASERNFTRAAEITHVTQSGLSAAIRNLEREMRAQLFDRHPVDLTMAGHAFLPRARRMLEEAREALRELAQVSGEVSGFLTFAAEYCLGDLIDLSEVFSSFTSRYPSLSIHFQQLSSHDILERLAHRELTVALLAQAGKGSVLVMGREITTTELACDDFELVASPNHVLAGRSQVDWAELEEHAFIDFEPGWTVRQIVDDAFLRRRVARRSSFVVNDVHLLLELVQHGLGLALIPASFARKPQGVGLSRMSMHEPDLSWSIHFASANPSDQASRLFADAVSSSISRNTVQLSV